MNKPYIMLLLFGIFSSLQVSTSQAQEVDISTEIIDYVNSVLDKKVDRGECWDLLSKSLDATNAEWFPTEQFGQKVNYPKEKLQAGDMMRMLNVKYSWGGKTSRHYAIVYEVIDKTHLRIADQNVGGVRKVKIRDFDLSEIVKGELTFYRPQKKK